MNLRTKKKLLWACFAINIFLIAVVLASYVYIFIKQDLILRLITSFFESTGTSSPNHDAQIGLILMYASLGVFLLIYVIISIFYVIEINKNKQQFYAKSSQIRLICILIANVALGNILTIIILALAIFWKDDHKPENKKKYKKTKSGYKIAPCYLEEYKTLKKKKNQGLISKEFYDREFMKIVKKSNKFFNRQSNFLN